MVFWETIAGMTLVALGGYGLGWVSGVRWIPRTLVRAGELGLANRIAHTILELRDQRRSGKTTP